MTDKVFVDTNVLVYAHDADARSKREAAAALLRDLWGSRSGVLSPQVLQEFYVNVTRKISAPIAQDTARAVINTYSAWCVDVGAADLWTAFRIEDEARIGFWDALIVAAAVKAQAKRILTEDLNPGQVIAGVEITNPFAK